MKFEMFSTERLYQIRIEMATDLKTALQKRPAGLNCHLSNKLYTEDWTECGKKGTVSVCVCVSQSDLRYHIQNLITHQY